MAYWGAGDEARATEYCQSAREFMLEGIQLESILQELGANDVQEIPLLSLMFWRAGNGAEAKRFLDRCDELFTESSEADSFFSVWRFHPVTRGQFEADCHSQRQMIQGAAIRPYFLGKKPGDA